MNANDPDPIPKPDETISASSRTYAMSGKIMLSAIIILFFVVVLMVFLHLYARWYLLRARRRHIRRRSRNRRNATMVFFATDPTTNNTTVVPTSRGLDQSVIKSLPVFTFSDTTHKDPIECAVCLSEFEENESGRVLPNCKHTFHVDCIDMWFHSHSTCPLCRSVVEPAKEMQQDVEIAISIDPVVTVIDPVTAVEPGSSSGSSSVPVGDLGRKPAAIEVPSRRNFNEIENELTRRDSFRSPMSRMLSFTRMLSRDRRSASSPVAGASPSSSSCRIPVNELDIERGGETSR